MGDPELNKNECFYCKKRVAVKCHLLKSDEQNILKREATNRDPRGPPGSQKGPKSDPRQRKESFHMKKKINEVTFHMVFTGPNGHARI